MISPLLAVVYGLGSILIGAIVWLAGYLQGYEENVTGGWIADVDAWQWDALLVLGPVIIVTAVVFLVLVFEASRMTLPLAALTLQGVLAAVAFGFLQAQPDVGLIDFWPEALVLACGAALVYVRNQARQAAGTRRE